LKDLESYDAAYYQWDSEPGIYHVLIGNSSRNIMCDETFRLRGNSIYDYGVNTPMATLFEDERAVKVFEKNLKGIIDIDQFINAFFFVLHSPLRSGWVMVAASRVGPDEAKIYKQMCHDLANIER
jgi:beta-glucosidase